MAGEKFCLKWNEFEVNIGVAFRELREDKDFFDVTLACCDGEQLQAHKVILSACSAFFRNVLRRNPHAHPLLYLKGVKHQDLKSILDFMYHGEVNVAQDNLNSFLGVAEELKVKGLTQNLPAEKSQSPRPREKAVPPPSAFPPRPAQQSPVKRGPLFPMMPHPEEGVRMDGQGNMVKTEPEDQGGLASDNALLLYQDFDEDDQSQNFMSDIRGKVVYSYHYVSDRVFSGYSSGHKQRLIEYVERVEEEGGVVAYKCGICYKTSTRRDALTSHIENIHFPGAYKCYYCDLVFNSQNTRNVHIGRKHKLTPTTPSSVVQLAQSQGTPSTPSTVGFPSLPVTPPVPTPQSS